MPTCFPPRRPPAASLTVRRLAPAPSCAAGRAARVTLGGAAGMNRAAASIALLLHGGLLLAVWSGLSRPPAVLDLRPDRPALPLRLPPSVGIPARPSPPTAVQPLTLQPPAPLLIAPPQWQPGPAPLPAPPPPPSSALTLDSPAPERPSAREAPGREPLLAQAPAEAVPQALVPAALPPEHLACHARQAERHYPALLRERGIEGRVVVRVKVDEDGRAAEVQVLSPSGWRLMDEAARQVAAACAYQPARRGEHRLMAWIEYPVRFSLH